VVNVRPTEVASFTDADQYALHERTTGPAVFAKQLLNAGSEALSSVPPQSGYDVAPRGRVVLFAVVEAGTLKLLVRNEEVFGPVQLIQLPGPPRSGLPSPPAVLNFDTGCEAAWPRLGFVQEALVVTWQERCASGPWKVYARVLR
jgi:hypothetical protein